MKYVAIFHANLNYAFLEEHKYESTIRASYEVIFDTFAKHPQAKYVFEASGYTIDEMAKRTPDVLEKLKLAIKNGQCEFMGAPYAHPIMANIPEDDGYWSCEFAQRTYEKHLGQRAESFWNPECTWRQYVPRAFKRAGVKYLTLDFESYMTSSHTEYAAIERTRVRDIYWGGHLPWYPLDPDCKFLHRPFKDIVPGLNGMCRSDRLVGKYIGYFLGKTPLDDFISNVKAWTGSNKKGATIIIADDAEYCGTTGYYFVKYHRDYSRSFSVDPTAADKLDKLIVAVSELGDWGTFKEACEEVPAVEEPFFVEDGLAWHRTYAECWGNTPEARNWEPILEGHRVAFTKEIKPIWDLKEHHDRLTPLVEKFWFHLSSSANSDGRWPPPPAVTCPWNRDWVLNEIAETAKALKALREAVKNIPLPEPTDDRGDPDNDWSYGLHFTDKNPEEVRKLNFYELSHAIYMFHRMVDSKHADKKAYGLKFLKKCFAEWDRRGIVGVRPPSIRTQPWPPVAAKPKVKAKKAVKKPAKAPTKARKTAKRSR